MGLGLQCEARVLHRLALWAPLGALQLPPPLWPGLPATLENSPWPVPSPQELGVSARQSGAGGRDQMGPEVLSALACDSGQTVTVGADMVSPSFGSRGYVVLCILGLIEVSKATPTLKGLGLRLRKWNIRLGTAATV